MTSKILREILIVTVLLTACDDKIEEPLYGPGVLIVEIRSNVSIDMVFDLMNEKGVGIDYMSGFSSYSLLPVGSLTFINNQLITKSYLNKWGYSNQVGKVVNNRIELTTMLFEMDLESQLDWLETMEKSQLKDLGKDKLLFINVPPGTEKEWLVVFESHPYVRSASLNWRGTVFI